ncbi:MULTISPECIES: arginine decarboxylase [unclassified Streptomyces]|uniref:Orn/Lys/Arg family decarboxylase n=1 Tax=unclassified Streptomyces TaxID=2593676 RepID=UPI000DB9000B|nr:MULTISPECIES: arginine decarboxylase [unclassified Streptomyces]MYT72867.1 arginine decarboxylase [Streptomyces sp. SID8367]RAJ78843.1 arginine decarboxylase [Streptomyces sp. PsTaAH-137]
MHTVTRICAYLGGGLDGPTAHDLGVWRDLLRAEGLQVEVAAGLPAAGDGATAAAVVDSRLLTDAPPHRAVDRLFASVPFFVLLADPDAAASPPGVPGEAGRIRLGRDASEENAEKILSVIRERADSGRPVFFDALQEYTRRDTTSWHTPAHAAGRAFLTSEAGRRFHAFCGEDFLRGDISVSVAEFGSLLEHSGLIGAAEANAARVFGADRTLFVLNGTSTTDRIVGHYALGPGRSAVVDRNCHKAVLHALVLSGARPRYLNPTRNGYGLIGPVPPAELDTAPADLAVLTNSTYDGLCYDTVRSAALLARAVPRILFDEAWFGYAHFHPLYRGRYAMAVTEGELPDAVRPTVFSAQSTHKMLAALSQAAMLHVKSAPRAPVEDRRLDETYMMHASTSPSYPMIASLDVATAMMDGEPGTELIADAVREAVAFRQAMARTAARLASGGGEDGWFFGVWQPPHVTDPATGRRTPFAEAPAELLTAEPSCWELEPGAEWHGFDGLEDGYCLLDPLKVTLLCPGVTASGESTPRGVPAPVLSAFLLTRGITVEKAGDYTALVLFSLSTTRAKWHALLRALLDFKELYDGDAGLADVLPELVAAHPGHYRGITLRELCRRMHAHLTDHGHAELLDRAHTTAPPADRTPEDAYRRTAGRPSELLPLSDAAHRTAAAMIVVTPPGIPLLMPGENCGPASGTVLRFLAALEARDRAFPGFLSEIHGVHRDARTGAYRIDCLARAEPGA